MIHIAQEKMCSCGDVLTFGVIADQSGHNRRGLVMYHGEGGGAALLLTDHMAQESKIDIDREASTWLDAIHAHERGVKHVGR